MGILPLEENPIAVNCFYIDKWTYDRSILELLVKAEEVIVNGKTFYTPYSAYCSLARNKPDNFREICPNWVECLYSNGQIRDINPESVE